MNPSFVTASTIRTPRLSLPAYEHVSSQTIKVIEIVTFATDSLATSTLVGAIIVHSVL